MPALCEICSSYACYKNPSINSYLTRCKIHATKGMIYFNIEQCDHPHCTSIPIYNFPGCNKGLYCVNHFKSGMINVSNYKILKKTCDYPSCEIIPEYNFPNEIYPRRCVKHALPQMVIVIGKHRTNYFQNAERSVKVFSLSGNYLRSDDVYNQKNFNKLCRYLNCSNIPFGNKYYCQFHDNKNRCLYPECETRPSFNKPGQIDGIFCKKHASPEMLNVIRKKCLILACEKKPEYNYPEKTISTYCREHYLPGMVKVHIKRRAKNVESVAKKQCK